MKLETKKDKEITVIRTEVQENPDIVTKQLAEFVKNSDESLPSKFFENNSNSSSF